MIIIYIYIYYICIYRHIDNRYAYSVFNPRERWSHLACNAGCHHKARGRLLTCWSVRRLFLNMIFDIWAKSAKKSSHIWSIPQCLPSFHEFNWFQYEVGQAERAMHWFQELRKNFEPQLDHYNMRLERWAHGSSSGDGNKITRWGLPSGCLT